MSELQGEYDEAAKATLPAALAAAKLHARPERASMILVGDRAKIEGKVRDLKLGEIVVVDAEGRPCPAARRVELRALIGGRQPSEPRAGRSLGAGPPSSVMTASTGRCTCRSVSEIDADQRLESARRLDPQRGRDLRDPRLTGPFQLGHPAIDGVDQFAQRSRYPGWRNGLVPGHGTNDATLARRVSCRRGSAPSRVARVRAASMDGQSGRVHRRLTSTGLASQRLERRGDDDQPERRPSLQRQQGDRLIAAGPFRDQGFGRPRRRGAVCVRRERAAYRGAVECRHGADHVRFGHAVRPIGRVVDDDPEQALLVEAEDQPVDGIARRRGPSANVPRMPAQFLDRPGHGGRRRGVDHGQSDLARDRQQAVPHGIGPVVRATLPRHRRR